MARLLFLVHGAGLLLVFLSVPPAAAQLPSPSIGSCAPALTPRAACFRELESRRRTAEVGSRAPDHRYEGMAIGGGIGVAGGVFLGLLACGLSESDTSCGSYVALYGLGVGALGGFLGMMIGAQFPKEEAGTTEQPAPRDSVSQ